MKFCKACGTLYNDNRMECPRCATKDLEADEIDHQMSPQQLERERKHSWIQLLIGIPAFILVIYFIIQLLNSLRGN